MKLITQHDIDNATNSLHLLRATLNSIDTGMTGLEADAQARKLRTVYDATALVLQPLSQNSLHPSCQYLVADFQHLTRQVDDAIQGLNAQANYRGPTRATMTLQAKTRFIREHGEEAYVALPW